MEKANPCIRCGQCLSVCPVYNQTKRESDAPRGKMALLERPGGLAHAARDAASRCLLCGACAEVCAARADAPRAIAKLRAEDFHPSPSLEAMKTAMADRGTAGKLLRSGQRLGGAVLAKSLPASSGLRLRTPASKILGREYFPQPSSQPFDESEWPRPEATGRAALFVGCGARFLYPQATRAAGRLFDGLGHPLWAPPGQACCGLAHWATGNLSSARENARQNLAVFGKGDFDFLLTLCASCSHYIHQWPDLFEPGSPDHLLAQELAEKQQDASSWLLAHTRLKDMLGNQVCSEPEKIYYHAPCHARHGPAATDGSKKLLQAASRALKMEDLPPQCCGHGGSFNLKHPDLSFGILDGYLGQLRETRPRVITTDCTGCRLQFLEGAARINQGKAPGEPLVEVFHPLEILEQVLFKEK